MNIEQTAAVVGLIALTDRRVVDESVVRHWHDLVGDLDFDDACDAVKAHRRESADWLMPVHVIDRVRAVRLVRLEEAGDISVAMIADGVDPDDVEGWRVEFARRRDDAMRRHPSGRPQLVQGGGRS